MGRRSGPLRVGVVLGAGGTIGAAWLAGALDALHTEAGIDTRDAEIVVGTSAGSAIAALAATGMDPAFLSHYACGAALEGLEPADGYAVPPDADARRAAATGFRLARALPSAGPGSWRMALGTLLDARRHTPAALMAGWLPRGVVSTRGLRDGFSALLPDGWPSSPELWIVAAAYDRSGKRTVFGRDGAPQARLGDAVAASCAIPGFYRPVRIGGRSYVDGGVCSMSNLDLLAGRGLDLVVCLNPTSSLDAVGGHGPGAVAGALVRSASGRRLGLEARKVRAAGSEVLLLQPGAAEVRAMGLNLMRRSGREELAELSARATMRALRRPEARAVLDAARARRPGAPAPSRPRRAAAA